MKYKHVIGIDISKKSIDLCLLQEGGIIESSQTNNQSKSIILALKQISEGNKIDLRDVLLCAEYTGRYGAQLIKVCLENQLHLWIEHPGHIKLSQGMKRGKDDRKDAERIAIYAYRFMDRVNLISLEEATFDKLSYLCSERDLLVTDRAKFKAQIKDEKDFIDAELYQRKKKRYERLIKDLSKAIDEVEKEIQLFIDGDKKLSRKFDILMSIDGIGQQVAIQTLVATKGFTKFSNPRKFSCHAGCAPFRYSSGSSIRSRPKVSNRANKKLKQLFHMAALSSIAMKGGMQEYYHRKVAEGKSKMSVINAIRSKLISIMFALIRDNRKYQKNYMPALP